MMELKNKHMVVDALIKVVDASPIPRYKLPTYNYAYTSGQQSYNISIQEFGVWLNYVNSVLNISYQYTGLALVLATQKEVLNISNNSQLSIAERTLQIEHIILNLAQTILHYQ